MIHQALSFAYTPLHVPTARSGRSLIVLGLFTLLTACGGDGGEDDIGSFLPPGSVPTITMQPQSQTAMTGDTVTFSVAATGTGPLTYQWNKGLLSIPGATGASYTTDPLTLSDSGAAISVTVSNAVGRVFSDVVLLTVNANPAGIYYGTFTADADDTSLPMLAMVLRDGTVAAFVTVETFTTNVPVGVALSGITLAPAGSRFGSRFTAYTQEGFALEDGTTSFSGTIGGNVFSDDAIIGSIESPGLSGEFRLSALSDDYKRAASVQTVAGTYQHSYVVRDSNDTAMLIDATTMYDASGVGNGTDTAGCSVSSTTAVPDPTSNAYTVVSNSTCPGSAQRTFNGLMTLFPAGTGWQINNGVAFTTDTLVSIAHDGATGYLVIAQK